MPLVFKEMVWSETFRGYMFLCVEDLIFFRHYLISVPFLYLNDIEKRLIYCLCD